MSLSPSVMIGNYLSIVQQVSEVYGKISVNVRQQLCYVQSLNCTYVLPQKWE